MTQEKGPTQKGLGRVILMVLAMALLTTLAGCYTKVIRDDSVDAKVNRSLGGTGSFNNAGSTPAPNPPTTGWH